MGACSSRPKTKDEGSMEPSEAAETTTDSQQPTERDIGGIAEDAEKVPLVKPGEGEKDTAQASAKPTIAPGPDDNEDEKLSQQGISDSVEVPSEMPRALPEEKEVPTTGIVEASRNETNVDDVSDEVVQKDDVGGGGGNADNSRENERNCVSAPDEEAKICEDKAVVKEETGGSQADGAYVDKNVDLEKEMSPETPGKRNILVPGGEAMDASESAGVESPIIGVVQPIELMNESSSVANTTQDVTAGTDKVSDYESTDADNSAAAESLGEKSENVDVNVDKSDDAQMTSSYPVQEDFGATRGVEDQLPDSAVESIGLPPNADMSKDYPNIIVPPSERFTDGSSLSVNSDGKVEEASEDSKLDPHGEGSVLNDYDDGPTHKPGDKGTIPDVMMESSEASGDAHLDGLRDESMTMDLPGKSIDDKKEPVVEEKHEENGQMQTPVENVDGDEKPSVMLDEGLLGREDKGAQSPISKSADPIDVVHTASGDLAFENASDRTELGK